jgi:hypothetical protein
MGHWDGGLLTLRDNHVWTGLKLWCTSQGPREVAEATVRAIYCAKMVFSLWPRRDEEASIGPKSNAEGKVEDLRLTLLGFKGAFDTYAYSARSSPNGSTCAPDMGQHHAHIVTLPLPRSSSPLDQQPFLGPARRRRTRPLLSPPVLLCWPANRTTPSQDMCLNAN